MSGWTLDTDDSFASTAVERSNNHSNAGARADATQQPRSKARRAFFDGDDVETSSSVAGVSDKQKRNSLTLASAAAVSRRSQRNSRSELVVDESDDDDTVNNDVAVVVKTTTSTKPKATEAGAKAGSASGSSSGAPVRLTIAVKDECGAAQSGKSNEIALADVVRPSNSSTSEKTTADAKSDSAGRSDDYVHWLVRDFVQRTYPRVVLDVFDKENPAPVSSGDNTGQIQLMHRLLVGSKNTMENATGLEKLLVAWDTHAHHRQLVRPRTQSSSPSASSSSSSSSAASSSSKSKSKSSSTSRKKPQLSVTIASDVSSPTGTSNDDVDYNRLNHPGHTPKAQQNALLAAVMGEPGSTPKANAGELKALGFEDIDDTEEPISRTRTQLIPSNAADDSDDDDGDELSLYAKRKRAASRHNKHVYIGEQGHTPTKEYVFFRETPPRFVTETVEGAEQILRSLGGNPDAKRQQIVAAKLERFVELQSSDVAKYTVGQRVDNLGAQRNVTGLVSKLYGSRLCGSAGPGTIVIDTWMGSDTAPEAPQLSEDDEELIGQLLE